MKKLIDIIQPILIILLILFGLFIIYQIIQKILGGSWETEDIIIALLIFNITLTFSLTLSQVKLSSDYNHFRNQFRSLAKDFKSNLHDK